MNCVLYRYKNVFLIYEIYLFLLNNVKIFEIWNLYMLFGIKIVKMLLCYNSIENIVIFILDLK